MAYKAKTENALFDDFGTIFHFWAIHKSVGWGCTNRTDDVMLVQYLINVWAKYEALKMDGIFGNKTYNGIKSYQRYKCQEFSGGVKIDGRVTASHDGEFVSNSLNFYTIKLLNSELFTDKRIYYNDLRMDSLLPTLLCSVL